MGQFSTGAATIGLNIYGAATKTNVATGVTVGLGQTPVSLAGAVSGYSLEVSMATLGDECTLVMTTGVAATSDTPVSQVETATAAGSITGSGNALVTVTGARITGSPLALNVAVLNGDTAATWAGKVRDALSANTAISSVYTVGGSTTSIVLTETDPQNNDATLNIALDNGTCTGITAAPTSANTTAGVGGVKFLNSTGDGNDFEGVDLPTTNYILGALIRVTSGIATFTDANNNRMQVWGSAALPGYFMVARDSTGSTATSLLGTLTVTADDNATLWDATLICK